MAGTKQTIVEIPPNAGDGCEEFTIGGSKANTQKIAAAYANSPIHKKEVTDSERTRKFVQNLASKSPPSLDKYIHSAPLSMQNAAVYWGFEQVNIKFGVTTTNKIDDGVRKLYQPGEDIEPAPGFFPYFNFKNQGPDGSSVDVPPLNWWVPNFLSPSSISPPIQPHPGNDGSSMQFVKDMWQRASYENIAGTFKAVEVCGANSALQPTTLGVYAMGKSSYTEAASPRPQLKDQLKDE